MHLGQWQQQARTGSATAASHALRLRQLLDRRRGALGMTRTTAGALSHNTCQSQKRLFLLIAQSIALVRSRCMLPVHHLCTISESADHVRAELGLCQTIVGRRRIFAQESVISEIFGAEADITS